MALHVDLKIAAVIHISGIVSEIVSFSIVKIPIIASFSMTPIIRVCISIAVRIPTFPLVSCLVVIAIVCVPTTAVVVVVVGIVVSAFTAVPESIAVPATSLHAYDSQNEGN